MRAHVLAERPASHDPRIFLRGDPSRRGPAVPRRFLEALGGQERAVFSPGTARLELARAIASPANPLTARVLVNRVWQQHFGKGLVSSPSNFGLHGQKPSHAELLDYLADRFTAEGWSIKKLHRLMMLSSTYQQSSADRPDAMAKDPENRLLSRMNRQRLDFESLRDAMLSAAGHLDPTVGGPPVDLAAPDGRRRTLYGLVDRQNLVGMLRDFDFASPDAHTPTRHVTTVPQQALFLLNSPLVVDEAKALAERRRVGRRRQRGANCRDFSSGLGARAECRRIAIGQSVSRRGGKLARFCPGRVGVERIQFCGLNRCKTTTR